jgi:hypothetical protein
MPIFSRTVLPLTLLGATAVLGGCVGGASLDGNDEPETQPEAAETAVLESADAIDPDAAETVGTTQQAAVYKTGWECWRSVKPFSDRRWFYGVVGIWWGHQEHDAVWACNSWFPSCARDGGCKADFIREYWE